MRHHRQIWIIADPSYGQPFAPGAGASSARCPPLVRAWPELAVIIGPMSRKHRRRPPGTAVRKALNPVLRPARLRPAAAAPVADDASRPERNALVDAARGFAVTMMIAYHFCYDLTYHGWADWPMLDDHRWIGWRDAIVTSFVFLVGVSLALRDARERRGAGWLAPAFVRRWLQVVAAAALVTIASAVLFPDRYIYFGVLHFVAVALWVCRRAPRRPAVALSLGIAVLVIGNTVSDAAFDPRAVDWIGFAATKPPTEDYVPLFPWLGVTLIGCGLGGLWTRHDSRSPPSTNAMRNASTSPLTGILATMGRWSLTIYLAHQPLLFGAMGLVKRFA